MRRLLVITNAAAGSAGEASVAAAVEVLRRAAEVEVVATEDLDDLREALSRRGSRTVVAAGGDGSLHALLQALDDLDDLGRDGRAAPTLGLLPLGTGNDLSRTLGLPLDPEEAAAVIVAGRPVGVDVIRDDAGGLVVNVAHIGVGAEAGKQARPWKERFGRFGLGVLGYAVGGIRATLTSPGWRLRVVADGRTVVSGRRRVLQVAVANGRTIGGGAEIAPASDVSDGLADVEISYATGWFARLRYSLAMRRGRHHERDDVVHLEAREITVRARRGTFTVNTDGELSVPVQARTWRVESGAYRMRVPATSD